MTASRATRNHFVMLAIILVGGGCGNASVEAALHIAPQIHGTKSTPQSYKISHISDACLHLGGFLHVTFISYSASSFWENAYQKSAMNLGVLAKFWIIRDTADDWRARTTKLSNNHSLWGQMQSTYITAESNTKIGNVRTDVLTDTRPDLSQWESAMSMKAILVRARLFSPELSSTKQDVMQDCLT
jgi:hypothetical protein